MGNRHGAAESALSRHVQLPTGEHHRQLQPLHTLEPGPASRAVSVSFLGRRILAAAPAQRRPNLPARVFQNPRAGMTSPLSPMWGCSTGNGLASAGDGPAVFLYAPASSVSFRVACTSARRRPRRALPGRPKTAGHRAGRQQRTRPIRRQQCQLPGLHRPSRPAHIGPAAGKKNRLRPARVRLAVRTRSVSASAARAALSRSAGQPVQRATLASVGSGSANNCR